MSGISSLDQYLLLVKLCVVMVIVCLCSDLIVASFQNSKVVSSSLLNLRILICPTWSESRNYIIELCTSKVLCLVCGTFL